MSDDAASLLFQSDALRRVGGRSTRPPLLATRDAFAEVLHAAIANTGPGIDCGRVADALLASPVLARMVTDAEHRGKQAAREEDWSSEHDGRRWAISSQRTLLTEVVDAILADVFQGERDQARGHMLDVAAKVGRKRAGWWIDGALANAWDEGFQRAADETLSPFVPEGPTDQQNPYRTDER